MHILWRNKHSGHSHIRQINIPTAGFIHMLATKSYHNPTYLKLWQNSIKKPSPAILEVAWIRDAQSKSIISNA